MSKCWAECLGDCSGKISREHIFSAGVHFADEVTVQGLSWCPNGPVTVGLSSLTAKILCTKHNNDLSFADAAASATIKSFEEAIALHKFRSQYRRTDWTRRDFKVNGHELESWFLKTLINITFESEKLIGKCGTQPGIPPRELVEIAFQRCRFASPAGLYTIPSVGDNAVLDGRLRVTIMTQSPPTIVGAVFLFAGLRYFLYLNNDFTPGPENFKFHHDAVLSATPFLYRFRKVNFPVHGKPSHTVSLVW
jgi:hypothetical protein